VKDLRISALQLSKQRCERRDRMLRQELDEQRGSHAAQHRRAEASAAKVAAEAAMLQSYRHKLEVMTGGLDAFKLEAFNSCRRYLEVATERHRGLIVELENERRELDASAAVIKQIQRQINAIKVRCDLLDKRAEEIKRQQVRAADDEADEEAQDVAVARLIRHRYNAA
jgi:hypothetical protein